MAGFLGQVATPIVSEVSRSLLTSKPVGCNKPPLMQKVNPTPVPTRPLRPTSNGAPDASNGSTKTANTFPRASQSSANTANTSQNTHRTYPPIRRIAPGANNTSTNTNNASLGSNSTILIVIDPSRVQHTQLLTWNRLLTIIKAGHNPRFFASVDQVKEALQEGFQGDCLNIAGSIPYILKSEFQVADPVGAADEKRRGVIPDHNLTLGFPLREYLRDKSASNWTRVGQAMTQIGLTTEQQQSLCKIVSDAWINFSQVAMHGGTETVALTMIKPQPSDVLVHRSAELYGGLGSVGQRHMLATSVWPGYFVAEGYWAATSKEERVRLAQLTLGALVELATEIT